MRCLFTLSWLVKPSPIVLIIVLTACSPSTTATPTAMDSTVVAVGAAPTFRRQPTSTSGQTDTPQPTATSVPPPIEPTATRLLISGRQIAYRGVRFIVPRALATGVSAQDIPADKGLETLYPAYTEFTLVNYTTQNTWREPHIEIYSVVELGEYVDSINELKRLLAERPPALADQLPVLPEQHAGQLIDVQLRYLNFRNGSGVRVLTQFAQDAWPINNGGLVYVFEGLTTDGVNYVLAFLPVAAPFLPDKVDDPAAVPPVDGTPYPLWGSPDFESEYLNYREAVAQKLNGTSAQAFIPDLSVLDSFIESLSVESP